MHQLGDQWIEVIDGQEHMLKLVHITYGVAPQMLFHIHGILVYTLFDEEQQIWVRYTCRDLGILKDGLLPCPFCGQYPRLVDDDSYVGMYLECEDEDCIGARTEVRFTKQELFDDWNRRA